MARSMQQLDQARTVSAVQSAGPGLWPLPGSRALHAAHSGSTGQVPGGGLWRRSMVGVGDVNFPRTRLLCGGCPPLGWDGWKRHMAHLHLNELFAHMRYVVK